MMKTGWKRWGMRFEIPYSNFTDAMLRLNKISIVVFVFILQFCGINSVYAQDTIISPIQQSPYTQIIVSYQQFFVGNKWGIMDTLKRVIIPAINEGEFNLDHHQVSGGYGIFYTINNKTGFLHLNRKYHIPPLYDKIMIDDNHQDYDNTSSAIIVQKNGKYGLLYKNSDKVFLPCEYENIERYCNNFILTKNNKKGLYNYHAKELLACKYDMIQRPNGIWTYRKGRKWGYIRNDLRTGKVRKQVKPTYDTIISVNYLMLKKGKKWALLNEKDSMIIPFEYESFFVVQGGMRCGFGMTDCSEWSNNYIQFPCIVQKNDKFGIIDLKKRVILPFIYNESLGSYYDEFNTKITLLKKTNKKTDTCRILIPHSCDNPSEFYHAEQSPETKKWAISNATNTLLTPFQFEDVHFNYPKKPTVVINNKYGIFDIKNQQYIMPAIYQQIRRNKEDDLVPVLKNGKWGYFYTPQKRAGECIYDKCEMAFENYGVVQKNGKYGAVDTLCIESVPCKYDSIYDNKFYNGQANVRLNGKFGRIDGQNKVLIPIIYDEITGFGTTFYGVTLYKIGINGKYGLYNQYGEEILPIEYEAIEYSDTGNYYAPLRLTKNGLTRLVKVYR
jgi:hypothetical protein